MRFPETSVRYYHYTLRDIPEKRRSKKKCSFSISVSKVRGRAGIRNVRAFLCFASETNKTNRLNKVLKFHAESEGEMLSCPVQVTKVSAGVEIQFHVFLALDVQESEAAVRLRTDAPVASDQ